MYKTRTLYSDLGDRTDGKYSSSTSGFYIPSVTWDYLQEDHKWEYDHARSNASSTIIPPNGLGVESIESTTRKRPLFNAVRHETKYGFNYPFFICTEVVPSYATFQPYMRYNTTGNFGLIPDHLTVSWADVNGCQRRAWWSMQPRFESELSLLNFIYELKDFKSLVKHATKWRETSEKVRKLNNHIRRYIGRGNSSSNAGQTLAGATKALSQGWLMYQFAIKPLINDMANCLAIWRATVVQAQKEFAARGLARQLSHYSESLGEIHSGTWGSGQLAWLFTGAYQHAYFTATLEYTFDYKSRVGWDMYRKYLGMNLTAGVIWEGTPWSFLVDYFFKIGDAIHMASVDPNVSLNVLQYCESMLHTAHCGQAANPQNDLVKIFYCPSHSKGKEISEHATYIPINGYRHTIYERKLASPNKGVAWPRYQLPGKTQVWNMVALVRSAMK